MKAFLLHIHLEVPEDFSGKPGVGEPPDREDIFRRKRRKGGGNVEPASLCNAFENYF
jgi:hypothetical protein